MAAAVGRSLRAESAESVIRGLAATGIVVAILPPMLWLAGDALCGGAASVEVLAATDSWTLLAHTAARAAVVTAIAVAIGVPLGFLLGGTDVIARHAVLLVHSFPLFLPPFLLALGWSHIFGRTGFAGSERSSQLLFAEPGAVAVQALAFAPAITSLVVFGLAGIDPALEEAARVAAAPVRVAASILLPLVRPAVAIAAIVVFALALSELGVPMFVRVPAYSAAVFARLGGVDYDPGEAFALVLPLFGIALLLIRAERWIGDRPIAALRVRRDQPSLSLGRWRAAASVGCWIVAMLSTLPLLALLVTAVQGAGFAEVPRWIGRSLVNGLVASAAAATLITAAGTVGGWGLARRRSGARALDALTVFSFVTPAAVLGVGLVAAWNRPATQLVYSGPAILVIGYLARYAVIGSRPIFTAISQTSSHLEDAAAVAGARFPRWFARIVVPMHRRALAAAWVLAMVFCLRDLETAVLYYPPGGEPLTVRIFTLEANGPPAVVAALGIIHTSVTAVVLAAGIALAGGRR
jgi:iron(III) transport system permease protein